MRVMLTHRNVITIPKILCNQLGLELGKFYELEVSDDRLILKIDKSYESAEEIEEVEEEPISLTLTDKMLKDLNIKEYEQYYKSEASSVITTKQSNKANHKIKIESNLADAQNFKNKIYTDCKLVIRTKRSYINKFCEACQGQLAVEYELENTNCPYMKKSRKSSSKKIIGNITDNANKLMDKINSEVGRLQEAHKSKEYL